MPHGFFRRSEASARLVVCSPCSHPLFCLRILPGFAAFCRAILLKLFRIRVLFRTLDQHIGVRIPGGQPVISRVPAILTPTTIARVRTVSASANLDRIDLLLRLSENATTLRQFRVMIGALSVDCPLIRTGRKGLRLTFLILPHRCSTATSAKPTWRGN